MEKSNLWFSGVEEQFDCVRAILGVPPPASSQIDVDVVIEIVVVVVLQNVEIASDDQHEVVLKISGISIIKVLNLQLM